MNFRMRWTDPQTGLTLLAATLDEEANHEVQAEVFAQVKQGITIRHGEKAGESVRFDPHPKLAPSLSPTPASDAVRRAREAWEAHESRTNVQLSLDTSANPC